MIVIGVTLRVPREEVDAFRPAIEELVNASRAEPGVLSYSFAVDLLDPGLIRIFEVYADKAALDAHMASAHFAAWRPRSAPYVRIERWVMDATLRS